MYDTMIWPKTRRMSIFRAKCDCCPPARVPNRVEDRRSAWRFTTINVLTTKSTKVTKV